MILDEITKSSTQMIDENNDAFDLEKINYDSSIEHAIADLETILAELKAIKKTKNIHGTIRYSIRTNLASNSYKRNIKGKVML